MAFDVHSIPPLAPVAQRQAPLFCLALLTAASAVASLVFACATPFAAFAVVAAAMLPLRSALLVVAGSWLVNQGIGFGVLHYPVDVSTMVWGTMIGIAALAGTLAAARVLGASPRLALPLALTLALIGSYAAYELVLFAATPALGGAAAFAVPIVARIGLTSMAWLIGLVAVCEIVRLLGLARSRHSV